MTAASWEAYMTGAMYALWSDASPYRNVVRDQVMTHGAGVRAVATSQHRDSLTSRIVYCARVEFDDGAKAEMRTAELKLRDAFAAEFESRMAA